MAGGQGNRAYVVLVPLQDRPRARISGQLQQVRAQIGWKEHRMACRAIRRRAAQFGTLGYWMGQQFAGRGLMTEAVRLLVAHAFDQLLLHRVHAAFLPHNMASRRVLEKNGFREEGYAENYLQIDGKWADHVLFGLTRERYDIFRKGQAG